MSGMACSSSGMTSAMVAEAVARVDELWEVVMGCWEQWREAVPHIPGPMLVSIVCMLTLVSLNSAWGEK
jgi:hypothetical protein